MCVRVVEPYIHEVEVPKNIVLQTDTGPAGRVCRNLRRHAHQGTSCSGNGDSGTELTRNGAMEGGGEGEGRGGVIFDREKQDSRGGERQSRRKNRYQITACARRYEICMSLVSLGGISTNNTLCTKP